MSLIDDIRRDREAGTPGDWSAALGRGCHGVIAAELPEDGANFVALVANDKDTPEREPTRFANARRIARVPQLEARVLSADELAEAVRSEIFYSRDGAPSLTEALAKYEAANEAQT